MIDLKVYKYDDPNNYLGTIHLRHSPEFLDQLKASGAGSFQVPLDQIRLNPSLYEYRNFVKVVVNTKVVGGFLLGEKETVLINSEEYSGEGQKIIGEGFKVLLDDAAVEPYGGFKRLSGDRRAFNFSSKEEGSWYNTTDWIVPYVYGQLLDPLWSGSWKQYPEGFPAGTVASWIWASPYNTQTPPETCYFRHTVNIPETGDYVLYAACDNYLSVWHQGELLATTKEGDYNAWHKATKVELQLEAGNNTFGFTGANHPHGGNNPAGLVVALFKREGEIETLISRSGAGSWRALPYPAEPPAFSAGEILIKLLDEAAARGILFPTWFTPTFTAELDSAGNPWPRQFDWQFDLASSYASAVAKLEEVIGDIWFDAETMEIHALPQRGVDRTQVQLDGSGNVIGVPIKFERGKNLLSAEMRGIAKIKNHLKVRTDEGWLTENNEYDPSTAKYGKIEGSLEVEGTLAFGETLAQIVFAQRGMPEEGATYEVVTGPGMMPWIDYDIGDLVLAPDEQGFLVPRRIVSLSVTETATGDPTYTIEFDVIFLTNEEKLSRYIGKSTGGSGFGSTMSNTGTRPPIGSGPVVIPPAPVLTSYPLAPNIGSVTSVGAWDSNGVYPISEVTVNWAAVTENTDGSPTIPEYYEVWGYPTDLDREGDRLLATVTEDEATIRPLDVNQQWKFRVRAFNDLSTPSEFSDEITHTTAAPNTPLAPPTTPTLDSEMGLLMVTWDGKLNNGGVPINPPLQFRYVYVEVATASGGPYTIVGSVMHRDTKSVSIPGLTIGTPYWARLRAVDGVGLVSDPSPSATQTIQGVPVDQTILDAIAEAQGDATAAGELAAQAVADALTAQEAADDAADVADAASIAAANAAGIANSKAVVLYQSTAPAAEYRNANTLWIDTTGGANTPKRWTTGTTWVAVTDKAATDAAAAAAAANTAATNAASAAAAAQTTANNAASAASAAQGTANTAITNAATAQTKADTAFTNAATAADAAATAAGIAAGKGKVLVQSTAPGVEDRNNVTLWIDTTGGANTPKRWVSGTTWSAVTDKAATDAATAAATAASAAAAAQSTATAAQTAAGNAQTTANTAVTSASGRNAMYHATTAPSGVGTRTGDLWHQWSSMAVDGRLLGLWVWNGSWQKRGLDETYIPLLNIGAGTYGSLDGDRMMAKSIVVGKLLVADFTNSASGSDFEGVHPWTLPTTGMTVDTTQAHTGTKSLKISNNTNGSATLTTAIAVQPGEKWYVEFWAYRDSLWNGTPSNSKLRLGTQTGALIDAVDYTSTMTANEWVKRYKVITMPAGATGLQATLIEDATAGNVWIDDIIIRRMTGGELIVDGAITAVKVNADEFWSNEAFFGKVSVDHVSPSFGEDLNLSANGSVIIVAGAASAAQSAANTAQVTAQGALTTATDAQNTANGAQDSAIVASGAAQDAQSTAVNAQTVADDALTQAGSAVSGLQTMQTYYNFTPNGAEISKPGSPFAVAVRNDRIEMLENLNVVSYWNSGTMFVDSMEVEKIVLGNHQIEKYEDGTVVRSI